MSALGNDEGSGICVSVVVPALNSIKYLRECMQSILGQTLQEIEVLCVDAGSTDGTLELFEAYASEDSRVRIIKSDKRSYGYQLNLGIRAARGSYIGIVETDDYIEPSMYKSLYSCAAEKDYPDFVRGGFTMFASDSSRKYFWQRPRPHSESEYGRVIVLEEDRKKGVAEMCNIWAAIYRREFFAKNEIRLHESPGASYQDMSFSLLVGLLADTVVYVKDCYYFYRMDNAESSAKSASKWRCVIGEFQYAEEEFRRRGKYSGEIRQMVQENHISSCYWNASRLPEKERGMFIAEIQPEMIAYIQNTECYANLSDWGRKCAHMLKDGATLASYLAERQEHVLAMRPLTELIRKGERFVLAGTGRLGERLVSYQENLDLDFIAAAADNDPVRQGSCWHQYTILSMEDAVNQHKEKWFVVMNKYHSTEILQQLIGLGAKEDHILALQGLANENEFVGLLLDKAVHY